MAHYQKAGWFTKNVFNRVVAALTRMGVSVVGSRVLEVPGRKSGEPRRTPVNLMTFEGERYLVAPRGHTQWVRNLRVSAVRTAVRGATRGGVLGRGAARRGEGPPAPRLSEEVEAGRSGSSSEGSERTRRRRTLQRIAPDHPVFKIS